VWVSVDHGEIGVAQTGRSNLHHHFAIPGIVELKLVDAERLRLVVRRLGAHLVEHGSFDLHLIHVPLGQVPRHREVRIAACRPDHWKRETASAQPCCNSANAF
jgi:hypothetical protein